MRIDLVPARHLALRRGLPHLLHLGDGELLDEGVLRVDHHRERVERHRQLDVLDARLGAVGHLGLQDRARGVRDVGLAAAELLEAAAGARDADRHLDLLLLRLLEVLGDRLGHREHGARAVDLDDPLLCEDRRGGQRRGHDGYDR